MKKQEEYAIVVKDLHKTFKLPHEKHSTLKQAALNLLKPKSYEKFKALEGVSFEVKKGEFFGIVGRNGSGKSTLLKTIAGIYQPNKGGVLVNGKLTPFIELGVGFNPELTGRDNVFLNGAILGLTRKEIEEKYDEIVEFAELERFMDQKLKNYSSGMQVRLAFSIAIRAHNEILLIDEVLAVGDLNFQEKCYDFFREIKGKRTVIFVSHDLASLEEFCDRVAVVDKNKTVEIGDALSSIMRYRTIIADKDNTKVKEKPLKNHLGTGEVKLTKVEIFQNGAKSTLTIKEKEPFSMRIHFNAKKTVTSPVFGLAVKDLEGKYLIGPNTKESRKEIKKVIGKGYVDAYFKNNPVSSGRYSIAVSCFNNNLTQAYDFVDNIQTFRVIGDKRHGFFNLEPEWSVKN